MILISIKIQSKQCSLIHKQMVLVNRFSLMNHLTESFYSMNLSNDSFKLNLYFFFYQNEPITSFVLFHAFKIKSKNNYFDKSDTSSM